MSSFFKVERYLNRLHKRSISPDVDNPTQERTGVKKKGGYKEIEPFTLYRLSTIRFLLRKL